MDADGMTFACATTAEQRAARRAGLRASRIGLGGVNGVPDGALVSFGLAGSLDGLGAGAIVDARRVVDERGKTLWKGDGLGVPGAVPGTVLAGARIVDDPEERRRLHAQTGADVIDLESGVLARTGRLRGVVRAVSDTPDQPLRELREASRADGRTDLLGLARALGKGRLRAWRAMNDARCALRALEGAVRG
jgi:adenosylhomocysteine nucleosidase